MKSLILRSQWARYAALVGGLVVLASGFLFVANVHGQGAGGGGSSACTKYCTDNGFAWKKYDVTSGGPSGGFTTLGRQWSWGEVQSICRDVQSVWIHVVRNGAGLERAFAFEAGDGISSEGPPYSGYTNAHYYGAEGISQVHNYYNEALAQGISGTSGLTWGLNLEWFCYGQTPWTISVSSSVNMSVAEVGDTITWSHYVSNNGPGRTTRHVTWHYQNRGDWTNSAGPDWGFGSGTNSGGSAGANSSYTVQPSDFGRRLCRATSASPAGRDNAGWTESSAACVVVAKKPKVQVIGGDLIVGRGTATNASRTSNIITSVSRADTGRYYGSWGEYALIPTGTVTGMSSGSGFVEGVGSVNTCALNYLTFSNAGTSACGSGVTQGRYATSTIAPNIASRFPVVTSGSTATPKLPASAAASPVSLSSLISSPSAPRLYTSNATNAYVTGGSAIGSGKWVVINAPNTTVTITNNINYTTTPLTSVEEIPQVVIIAKNIIISSAVTNIDAWLIAVGSDTTSPVAQNGIINTCGAGAVSQTTTVNATICNTKLTINGPISANHLLLRRTAGAGSGAAADDPAEVFNLRADAYIWATSYSPGTGRLPTVTTKELPPRF